MKTFTEFLQEQKSFEQIFNSTKTHVKALINAFDVEDVDEIDHYYNSWKKQIKQQFSPAEQKLLHKELLDQLNKKSDIVWQLKRSNYTNLAKF